MELFTNKKTVEDFKIFLNSLYEHNIGKGNDAIVEKFAKDLRNISGKNRGMVEIEMTFADGKIQTEKTFLDCAAKDGINIPEDVASFKVSVMVHKSIKNDKVRETYLMKDVFNSAKFIVAQNTKEKEFEEGAIVIKDMLFYQDMTGNRIRFGSEDTLEV